MLPEARSKSVFLQGFWENIRALLLDVHLISRSVAERKNRRGAFAKSETIRDSPLAAGTRKCGAEFNISLKGAVVFVSTLTTRRD